MPALPAHADAFDEAFSAPQWQRDKSPGGPAFDCVAESCVPPAHVVFMRGPASRDMATKIKSGEINRAWAEKLAVTFRRKQGDKITVLSFDVQKGQVPGWTLVYQCDCDGRTSFIASRTVAAPKLTMTFYSLAQKPEAAEENMNKLIEAALGNASR